jgi:hypothetical protein
MNKPGRGGVRLHVEQFFHWRGVAGDWFVRSGKDVDNDFFNLSLIRVNNVSPLNFGPGHTLGIIFGGTLMLLLCCRFYHGALSVIIVESQ